MTFISDVSRVTGLPAPSKISSVPERYWPWVPSHKGFLLLSAADPASHEKPHDNWSRLLMWSTVLPRHGSRRETNLKWDMPLSCCQEEISLKEQWGKGIPEEMLVNAYRLSYTHTYTAYRDHGCLETFWGCCTTDTSWMAARLFLVCISQSWFHLSGFLKSTHHVFRAWSALENQFYYLSLQSVSEPALRIIYF